MTKIYIKINGTEYLTGVTTPKPLFNQKPIMTADYDHPLVVKNKLAVQGYYYEKEDKIVAMTLEGDFNDQEIKSLIDNPYQIFLPIGDLKLPGKDAGGNNTALLN